MRSHATLLLVLSGLGSLMVMSGGVPRPNAAQLEFMEMELVQFMHFGAPTFWDPPTEYLYTTNPTYHNCLTTSIDHGNQTEGYYPCLNPNVFHPTNMSADDWMEASAAMGMREICITAHHEGGFALFPSNYTEYSVKASSWRNGTGDVLREFVDAAKRWDIGICYYLNVQADGYMALVANYSGAEFIRRQVGMVNEVIDNYGPVHRFWFDGSEALPSGTNLTALWSEVYETIRTRSPSTLISPYRGDICSTTGSLYLASGPQPNTTQTGNCAGPSETGTHFYPSEMHGVTIQQGPDGNTDGTPTYWFWHPWACAGNITGCPWQGHGNASRLFNDYLGTVGHGAVLNINIPPDRTGRMNASVAQVMRDFGTAVNQTFKTQVAGIKNVTFTCGNTSGAVMEVPPGAQFDYIMTMEDLTQGQRIANYSIEFQRLNSSVWETLVPPVWKTPPSVLKDRPDGHDPRDSYIGHKRIDVPVVPTSSAQAAAAGMAGVEVVKVRFVCLRALEEPVYIRSFSLHKRSVPWEDT